MNNITEKGFAEKVPDENLHLGDGKCGTFLTTGFIIRKRKKKISVVFGCNASYQEY